MRAIRTSLLAGPGLAALGALVVLGASACAKKDTDAKIFQKCGPDTHCAEPNICLSFTEDTTRGYCMKLCDKDSECPKGLRCTGRHQKHAGAVDTYCRNTKVGLGGGCRKLSKGCKKALR